MSHPFLYRTVADYRLTDFVGSGGMGEVFRATHIGTGQQAAVKVLYRPEFAARFRNEAAVQASLSHPNIAALYDFSLIDNRPALVLEWIDGQSLDELIRRRKYLSNQEATLVIRQMANAVAYLHQQGIIHRDLKPSNVRLCPDGQVKVLDFGIAKGRLTPQLTQAGFAVGTTEFMAPEQFKGRVEAKSDVWALGVLLYEMTTGHLPFDDKSPLLLRQQIERGHYTSPQLLNPALSPELTSVISACLQANPARRPAAAAIDALLDAPANQPGDSLVPASWRQALPLPDWTRSFWYWIAAGVLGAVGIALVDRTVPKLKKPAQETVFQQPVLYEQIQVEVLNADYDLELVMPDGTVHVKEPFVIQRKPGQPLPITIRHQGAEQQFVIEPDVKELYQCYFDR